MSKAVFKRKNPAQTKGSVPPLVRPQEAVRSLKAIASLHRSIPSWKLMPLVEDGPKAIKAQMRVNMGLPPGAGIPYLLNKKYNRAQDQKAAQELYAELTEAKKAEVEL